MQPKLADSDWLTFYILFKTKLAINARKKQIFCEKKSGTNICDYLVAIENSSLNITEILKI